MTAKTDARNITTQYSYDALNRIIQKSYSDGTQAVNYSYDAGSVPNSKGHLTQMNNWWTIENYTAYDALGNVTGYNEQNAGQTYNFSYAYNLSGALTSETYPSGRVVETVYGGNNEAYSLTGTQGGVAKTYIAGSSYLPSGTPYWQWYGNNVVPVWVLNSQLQPVSISATVNDSPNNYLFVENLDWGTNQNNGVLRDSNSYVGNSVPWSALTSYYATFGYDGLNRVTAANDSNTNNCGGLCWYRTFQYDQWGNLSVTSNSGVPLNGATPYSQNGYNPYNSSNQLLGAVYDAAGNVTHVESYWMGYDAENRQISSYDTFSQTQENYAYDGAGERVQKWLSGGSVTSSVYDAFGQLAAEYSPANTVSKEYIRFGGQVVAIENASGSPCATCYVNYDHLGSVRLVTDQNANVIARHDYLPFGEEIAGGSAGRNAQFGAMDNVSQRFTGQTRDPENGLDFFNARYFAGVLGRFNSPDPANAGAVLGNPQSWNGYSYVWNNPMNAVDPSGMFLEAPPPDDGDDCDACILFVGGYYPVGDGEGGGGGGGQKVKTVPVPTQSQQPTSAGSGSAFINSLLFLNPQKNGTFTRMPLPPNHLTCTSLGTSYVAPPSFSLKVIVKAGQGSGRNLFALRRAVGQGGTFDFQRVTDSAGNVQFYGSYTPVSNFAVGAYEFGAGFTRGQGDFLSNLYATLFSSNAGDPKQELYRHLGYDAATKGDAQCH